MPAIDVDGERVAVGITVGIRHESRLNADLLARRKPVAPVEDAALGVEYDRLQKPARFDVGRKLVIGEHREQRSDRMDVELTHPACASPRTVSAPAWPLRATQCGAMG
jgi:hypothetical protein